MATKKTKTTKKMAVEDLLSELQARFDIIDGKLDALLSKSAALSRMVSTERDPDFKTHATVTKNFPIPQDAGPRERKMYKAVCAECKKDCEVPFVPRAERPVYCKECYRNRRNKNNPRSLPNREELVSEIAKTLNIDIPEPAKTKASKSVKTKSKAKRPKAKSHKR